MILWGQIEPAMGAEMVRNITVPILNHPRCQKPHGYCLRAPYHGTARAGTLKHDKSAVFWPIVSTTPRTPDNTYIVLASGAVFAYIYVYSKNTILKPIIAENTRRQVVRRVKVSVWQR